MNRNMADPGPAALTLFGFTLVVLGVQRLWLHEAEGALIYAAFVAALAQTAGGVLALIRGEAYLGTVLTTFGVWLLGFYLLRTDEALRNTESLGIYVLVLLGPLGYLSLPAFRQRRIDLQITFMLITAMILCLGIQYLAESQTAARVAGVIALASALVVWYLAYERLNEAHGEPSTRLEQNDAHIPQKAPVQV